MTAPMEIPIEFRLLGQLGFERTLQLQSLVQREAWRSPQPKMTVLFCEHPRMITIGRDGSRAHVRMTDQQLERRRLSLQWVSRRGGCVVHGPGQLAMYAIAPLENLQMSRLEFDDTLRAGLLGGLESLGVRARTLGDALVGRTGVLASLGTAADESVTGFGGYLNVHPDLADGPYIDAAFDSDGQPQTMSGLIAETRAAAVRMPRVRSALVESITAAFDTSVYHLYTGHPQLARASA